MLFTDIFVCVCVGTSQLFHVLRLLGDDPDFSVRKGSTSQSAVDKAEKNVIWQLGFYPAARKLVALDQLSKYGSLEAVKRWWKRQCFTWTVRWRCDAKVISSIKDKPLVRALF
jgi:hypothetical protein